LSKKSQAQMHPKSSSITRNIILSQLPYYNKSGPALRLGGLGGRLRPTSRRRLPKSRFVRKIK